MFKERFTQQSQLQGCFATSLLELVGEYSLDRERDLLLRAQQRVYSGIDANFGLKHLLALAEWVM